MTTPAPAPAPTPDGRKEDSSGGIADRADTLVGGASVGSSRGFWAETGRRFRRRRLAMLALGYVALMALVAVLAPALVGTKPIICRYKQRLYFPAMGYIHPAWENSVFRKDGFRKEYAKNLVHKKRDPESWAIWPLLYQDPFRAVRENEWPGQPGNPPSLSGHPNRHNWLGTSDDGIDVLAQLAHGARTALLVGFVSMGIAATIGILVGSLAGYFGGWVDILLSRLLEVVMCVPLLVIILALMAVIEERTIWHMMVVIGCTGWTGIARLVRAEFLRLKTLDFVYAARALGASQPQIIFLHILRNALAPVFAPITFGIASAVILEGSLSFIGFGAPPPTASWGNLLSAGRATIEHTWWLVLFPGLAIFLTVMAYNLIGEGLQEATDPRLRGDGR